MITRKLGFVKLMEAVYARLTADDSLTADYSFFNHVPKNTPYPYHVIGRLMGSLSEEFTTRDTEAEDNTFQVDSWVDKTTGMGDKECAERMNNIIQELTLSILVIENYNNIRFVLDYAEIMLDPENPELLLRHGVLRFRVDMSPS